MCTRVFARICNMIPYKPGRMIHRSSKELNSKTESADVTKNRSPSAEERRAPRPRKRHEESHEALDAEPNQTLTCFFSLLVLMPYAASL